MAKASGAARRTRNSLRNQVRGVVSSAQKMRKKMTGMPVNSDFSHLHKLNSPDKSAAGEISRKYDNPKAEVINNPELLQQLQALAKTSEDLAATLDTLSEDFKRLKKNGEGSETT
jgi:metal-dependent amidase/aminoacylase/carboxypeptidase family protein